MFPVICDLYLSLFLDSRIHTIRNWNGRQNFYQTFLEGLRNHWNQIPCETFHFARIVKPVLSAENRSKRKNKKNHKLINYSQENAQYSYSRNIGNISLPTYSKRNRDTIYYFFPNSDQILKVLRLIFAHITAIPLNWNIRIKKRNRWNIFCGQSNARRTIDASVTSSNLHRIHCTLQKRWRIEFANLGLPEFTTEYITLYMKIMINIWKHLSHQFEYHHYNNYEFYLSLCPLESGFT